MSNKMTKIDGMTKVDNTGAPRADSIQSQLSRLEEQVLRLDDALCKHIQKLTPLLRPDDKDCAESISPPASDRGSSIRVRIGQISNNVKSLSDLLIEATSRLDLE